MNSAIEGSLELLGVGDEMPAEQRIFKLGQSFTL